MGTFKPTRISPQGVVGRVVAPAEDKFDGKLTEIRLAIGHGYKDKQSGEWKDTGTTWLTYAASGDYAAPLKAAGKGDLVEITGDWSLETREYPKKDGTTGLGVTVKFGDFAVIDSKSDAVASDEAGW